MARVANARQQELVKTPTQAGFLSILCFILSFAACHETKKDVNKFKVEVTSRQLRDIVTEYNKEIISGYDRAVITIDIQKKSDTTILFISSLIEPGQSYTKNHLPSFFTLIDKRPVLIYSGFENLMSINKGYVDEFEKVMRDYWIDSNYEEGEIILIPPNYNTIVWRITFISDKLIERIDLSAEKSNDLH